ncbi:MAG: hypothetical protein ACKV2V_07620 [Blastocatellia bacterium]
MDARETRKLEMFCRVLDYGAARPQEFPPESFAAELFTELAAVIAEARSLAARQDASLAHGKQKTARRNHARRELREMIDRIERTRNSLLLMKSRRPPGKPRLPRDADDHAMVTWGRVLIHECTPMLDEYIHHEMAPDFLETLAIHVEALDEETYSRHSARHDRTIATDFLGRTLAEGMGTIKQLDSIMHNRYMENPEALREWKITRRIGTAKDREITER